VLAATYGTDAGRWGLLREVPRQGDADFTAARPLATASDDLPTHPGTPVRRGRPLVHRHPQGGAPRARAPAGDPARPRADRRPREGGGPPPGGATSPRGAGRLRLAQRHRGDLGGGRGGEPLRGAGRTVAAGPGRT